MQVSGAGRVDHDFIRWIGCDHRRIAPQRHAEFDERDVPAGQLDFEWPAVMRGAEQHGLLLQQGAALAIVQHALDDIARLVSLITDADSP